MSTKSVSTEKKSVFCPTSGREFGALSHLVKTVPPCYSNINKRNTKVKTTHQIKLGREVKLSVIDVVFKLVLASEIAKKLMSLKRKGDLLFRRKRG